MAPKVDEEARVTIKKLNELGVPKRRIAKELRVTEGAVRYHLRRQAEGAKDGRARQEHLALKYSESINAWLESRDSEEGINLVELYEHLVRECDYPGTLRSVQRYFKAHYPKPKLRARRRVETPPGAQAQVDWACYPGIWVGGRREDLFAFHLVLSHSRYGAMVWSKSKDQLSWLHVHNESFRRIEGVTAVIRPDNEKTAVSRGAGPWGKINRAYMEYSKIVCFHIDPCLPRSPEHKGKVERDVGVGRTHLNPQKRHWNSVDELQEWTDEGNESFSKRRICPATGASVYESWREEIRYLAPLPILPEPFDLVKNNLVAKDCTVSFEGRQYSVPFSYIGQRVEVRGCSGKVQILKEAQIIAEHPRHTEERILLNPAHFEGRASEKILPPLPLGKMGKRLEEIAKMAPESRPIDLYAALAEVSR